MGAPAASGKPRDRHEPLGRPTFVEPRASAATGHERAGEKRREEGPGHRTSLSLVATAERGTGSSVATCPEWSQRK